MGTCHGSRGVCASCSGDSRGSITDTTIRLCSGDHSDQYTRPSHYRGCNTYSLSLRSHAGRSIEGGWPAPAPCLCLQPCEQQTTSFLLSPSSWGSLSSCSCSPKRHTSISGPGSASC